MCQRLRWAVVAPNLPPPLQGAGEQRRELRGGKRLTANMSGERLITTAAGECHCHEFAKGHLSTDASYLAS